MIQSSLPASYVAHVGVAELREPAAQDRRSSGTRGSSSTRRRPWRGRGAPRRSSRRRCRGGGSARRGGARPRSSGAGSASTTTALPVSMTSATACAVDGDGVAHGGASWAGFRSEDVCARTDYTDACARTQVAIPWPDGRGTRGTGCVRRVAAGPRRGGAEAGGAARGSTGWCRSVSTTSCSSSTRRRADGCGCSSSPTGWC